MSKGALGLLSAYWPEDTPRYAHLPLKTVGDMTIYPASESAPGRAALVSSAGVLSYGDFAARARRVADSLRRRIQRASRLAIALPDAAEMLVALFGGFDAEALVYLSAAAPSKAALDAFQPDLVVAPAPIAGSSAPLVGFDELIDSEGRPAEGRRDIRIPILVLPAPAGRGEVHHSHRSLVATAVSVGRFFMLAEPPTHWYTVALMLGALQRGATVWAGWEPDPPAPPERVDYAVLGWERAGRMLETETAGGLPARIAAGAIVGIEGPFSASRRSRLARRLQCDVLTLLGRSDLGPYIGSHPSWFLNDAAGIPLPNVDLRPLNPADGTPLNLGWELVEQAEIGVKSALAPAGAPMIQGWLRSGIMAEIDPTGFFFLRQSRPIGSV